MMDDEEVGINNGKLVIRVVNCMIMIRLVDVLVVADVFEIKWWAVHEEYNGTA